MPLRPLPPSLGLPDPLESTYTVSSAPRDSLLPTSHMEATYTLDRTGSVAERLEGLPMEEMEEGDDSTFLTEAPAVSQVG